MKMKLRRVTQKVTSTKGIVTELQCALRFNLSNFIQIKREGGMFAIL